MAELQAAGPSSSAGSSSRGIPGAPGAAPGAGAGAGADEAAQKQAAEDEGRRTMMSQILSPEARERRQSSPSKYPLLLDSIRSRRGCERHERSCSLGRWRQKMLTDAPIGCSLADSARETGPRARHRAIARPDGPERSVARTSQRRPVDRRVGSGARAPALSSLECLYERARKVLTKLAPGGDFNRSRLWRRVRAAQPGPSRRARSQ